MQRNLFLTVIGLSMTMSVFAYSGGNGSEQNPYLIATKADMEQLAANVNSGQTYAGTYFLLARNLTGASDTVTTVVSGF